MDGVDEGITIMLVTFFNCNFEYIFFRILCSSIYKKFVNENLSLMKPDPQIGTLLISLEVKYNSSNFNNCVTFSGLINTTLGKKSIRFKFIKKSWVYEKKN